MPTIYRLKQVPKTGNDIPAFFNQEVVDVVSKEITELTADFSDVRVSSPDKQPRHVGFPYVLHAPTECVKTMSPQVIRSFILLGVDFKEQSPCFYKAGRSFTRMRIKNGDLSTAERLISLLEKETSFIFKNWK